MFALNLNIPTRSKPQFLPKRQMALGFHLLCPKIFPQPIKFQTHPFPSVTHLSNTFKPQISCTNSVNDSELASDLSAEVEKMSTHLLQREEAMKKSRQLLFAELCQYLGLRPEELKKKWKKMEDDDGDGGGGEEDKWVLVKGFVSEWSVNFHPLSARSVKELVEEHLAEDNAPHPPPHSCPSNLLPDLWSENLFPDLWSNL